MHSDREKKDASTWSAAGKPADEIVARESGFHDQWARSWTADDVRVQECFEAATAPENRFILNRMGQLAGKKIVDIGAGLGESSVYFALQGANVTAVDASPEMIRFAQQLARSQGVTISGVVCPAESLDLPDGEFDFVYAANLIHHVHEREQLFQEMRRVLKPGGCFYSWDPLKYNPAINIYRRMATEVRTEDELPLGRGDVALARRYFQDVGHREFWLATLMLFAKYYCLDHVHPNQDRYWKRILKEKPGQLWWWYPLAFADRFLTRISLVRWLAWNMVMWGRKPDRGRTTASDK